MGNAKGETPKTYSLRITEYALKNLDEITGYIAYVNHQPLNAIRVGDKVYETIAKIEKNPFSYRECEEIQTKTKIYRKAVCMSWLIIYKVTDLNIIILGIIHSSRRTSKIGILKRVR